MKSWKTAFFLCVLLLIASNIFWLYVVLDQSISYTYLGVSYDEQKQANEELGRLIVGGARSYSKKDLVHLLRLSKPDAFIVEEEDLVVYEGIYFRFSEDKLISVE